jgi:spermidine/putrescine transport system substrate-binding protein
LKEENMKKHWPILVAVAVILAACQPAAPAPTAAPPASSGDEAASGRCGDRSQLAAEIRMYNWVEYLDPDILAQFEAECGVKVIETNYDSNETLLATLQAGGANYDIIVPSDYMVQVMISEGLLEPLDFNVVANIAGMSPFHVNQYFDPEQRFTVPYMFGTSGFAVDTNAIADPQPTWKMVFEPSQDVCGKISMLDDQRETIGAALMYLGYSINDVEPAHLEEAKNLLIQQAECVKAYDSQTNDDLLIQGETVIGHIWTGDAILAGSPDTGGREGITYLIPQEGCTIWQDNLAVPTSAQNKYTAMVFINYLSDPEIAAQNAEFIGYGSPSQTAREFIDPEVLGNESIYPPEDVMQRLQWIEDVGDALELYDRIWTEFKAAIGG